MINIKQEFENIMFVGDPHLTSIQISRRQDDVHISNTILSKMEEIAKISHEKKCYTVILGDLFDNDKEKNISLLTRTIKVLKQFYYKPITIIGNHEKTEDEINETNMISTLVEAGVLDVIDNNKISVRLKVNSKQIEIGGTNYGSKIPSKVTKKSKDTSSVIWITHHDLMFKDYYPGSQPLQEIEGVSIAVNGHMHGTQPQIQVKSTTWCCPGNITRQSIDMSEHIPRVWLWNLQHHNENYEKLIPIDLTYKKDIFRQIHVIEADKKNDFSLSKTDDKKLSFIEMAENAVSQIDNNATSDKELVKNFMANLFNIEEVPEDIQIELFEMLENVTVETEE